MWPVYLVITWFVLALVIPPVWSSGKVYARARNCREVACPVRQSSASIQPDALYAIKTNLTAEPRWRVQSCSLWPNGHECQQECLVQLESL